MTLKIVLKEKFSAFGINFGTRTFATVQVELDAAGRADIALPRGTQMHIETVTEEPAHDTPTGR